MCMNTPNENDQHSERTSSFNQTGRNSPNSGFDPISSSETSTASSHDDHHDIVEFGPLKVKQRKKPAPTLATGRRSKYETLTPEEEYKRNIRRERNRAAAERVRISRLNIEQELQGQIDTLQNEEEKLMNNVQMLQYRKFQLENRIHTHGSMCPSMTTMHSQSANLSSIFNSNTSNSSSLPSNYFDDLLINSPAPLENNYFDSFSTMIPDDIDDFIMNP